MGGEPLTYEVLIEMAKKRYLKLKEFLRLVDYEFEELSQKDVTYLIYKALQKLEVNQV